MDTGESDLEKFMKSWNVDTNVKEGVIKFHDIDEDKFKADLTQAAQWAFNLSVEAAIVTQENREMLIQKAFRESKALALEANILADAVVAELLAKAEAQAKSVSSAGNIPVGSHS